MNDNAKTEDWDWARAAQPQTAAGATASVQMRLTQADKQTLRELGYSDEAISHMTPDAAAGIISRREAALPSAYTTPEPPPADPGCAMTTLELFDAGLGSRLISVTAPDGIIAVNSSLKPENLGKAPGRLGPAGWTGFDLNNPKFRCRDHATVKLWTSWNANTGFVTGDGYVVFDNDEGEDLDRIIERECRKAAGPEIALLRRFVRDPNHKRSAFVFRVLDFVGDTATVGNQTLKFKRNGKKTELQVLAPGKQFVIGGMHPGTRSPYVLSRRVSSISDIPVVSADQFDQIINGLLPEMKAIGWELTSRSASATTARTKTRGGTSWTPDGDLEEVVWVLERLPNRDGGTTPLDDYLDIAENYWNILYAILGALGPTPEAKAIWLEWAKGRAQPKQDPATAWASASGSEPRLGMSHLRQLAWRFIGAEYVGSEYVARQFPEDDAWREATKEATAASGKVGDAHHDGIWAEWRAALERLRAARPAPIFGTCGWLPHPSNGNVLILDPDDISPVPLRPEITDRHTRGEVSMLVGSPGVGKSTLGTSYVVAIAYENPAAAAGRAQDESQGLLGSADSRVVTVSELL